MLCYFAKRQHIYSITIHLFTAEPLFAERSTACTKEEYKTRI